MKRYYIIISVFLISSCVQMNPNDPNDGDHSYESKYEKYMQQCEGWDDEICLQRYDEIIMKKYPQKTRIPRPPITR